MSQSFETEKNSPGLLGSEPSSRDISTSTAKDETERIGGEVDSKPQDDTDNSTGAQETAKEPDYITGVQLYLVNLAITLAAGLLFLDTAIIATAIPRITDEFKSLPDVGWYGSAYQLGSAALLPLSGKIYTHFSTKWSFLGFLAFFEFGSLLCGAAQNSVMLIVGRAIAGAGGSGLISGALTIIASCLPLEKRAAWTGMLMGFSQLGVVLGPILGGVLTQYSTWRWCFYINLPVGGLCAVLLIIIKIPDQIEKLPPLKVLPRLHHQLDLVGFALFAPAVIQLLLAVQYGENKFPWNSSTIIGLFCGSGATFMVWFAWNWRLGDLALIPVSMVAKRPVWTSSLTQAFSMTVLFITTYFLPIYFQTVQNASPLNSGVKLLPSIVSQLIFAVLSGGLVSRTGYIIPYAIFGTALAAIGSGLFTTLSPSTHLGRWFGYQVLAGAGRGMAMQMPIIAMQAVLKPSELSMANSLMMFSQALLTAITLAVCNTLLDEGLRSEIPKHASAVDPQQVIAAGATRFRSIVAAKDIPGVILAYATSIDHVFYVGLACAIVAFLIAPGMGWFDIRKKKTKAPTEEALEAGAKGESAV